VLHGGAHATGCASARVLQASHIVPRCALRLSVNRFGGAGVRERDSNGRSKPGPKPQSKPRWASAHGTRAPWGALTMPGRGCAARGSRPFYEPNLSIVYTSALIGRLAMGCCRWSERYGRHCSVFDGFSNAAEWRRSGLALSLAAVGVCFFRGAHYRLRYGTVDTDETLDTTTWHKVMLFLGMFCARTSSRARRRAARSHPAVHDHACLTSCVVAHEGGVGIVFWLL